MNTTSRSRRRGTRRAALILWLFGAVLGIASCRAASDPTGGETHFLEACTASETCGNELSCVCGVCTRSCASADECRELSAAECFAPTETSACADAGPIAHCDVTCNADAECRALSESHRCVLNRCRAGTGSAGDAGASAGGTSGEGGSSGAGGCPTAEVAPNEVLVIGDSFFAISHQITAFLEEHAREAGALGEGERYRDNSNTIDNALAMGGNGIANQYQRGVGESSVKVVIMNGGGPDMLLSSCTDPVVECPALVAAADAAQELLAQMTTDGVSHVVYAFYPDPVDAAMRERMDALRQLIEPVCAQSPVPCHWVDLRATLSDPSYLSSDGLLPTAAGSEATAGAIWATMQTECIAQ